MHGSSDDAFVAMPLGWAPIEVQVKLREPANGSEGKHKTKPPRQFKLAACLDDEYFDPCVCVRMQEILEMEVSSVRSGRDYMFPI